MSHELFAAPETTAAIHAIGNALLHSLWQCALLGAIAWLALRSLRQAAPQARYGVVCATMLGCVLWPTIELLQALTATQAISHTGTNTLQTRDVLPAMRDIGHLARPQALSFETIAPWLVVIWACGASMMMLRIAFGLRWVARLRQAAQAAPNPEWQQRLDTLAGRLGLKNIRLAIFDGDGGPLSAGLWRPIVLVPASLLARMPTEMLEALLAHELAHIRRHDYLINLLQRAAEALLFFHPVVWWLSRRLREERELVADHTAAAILGEPRQLAMALAELDRCMFSPPTLAQAAHGGHLMSRIQSLLRPQHPNRASVAILPLTALAIACVGCFAYAKSARVSTDAPALAVSAPKAAVARANVKVGTVVASTRTNRQSHVTRIDDNHETIALIEKGRDGMRMSGTTDDVDAISDAKAKIDGDFIWLRRNGQAYIVRDPQTIAKVRGIWSTRSDAEIRMDALSQEMESHSGNVEKIGARMEALGETAQESQEMRQAAQALETLAKEQEALAMEQAALAVRAAGGKAAEADNARLEALNQQMEALGARMESMSAQLESEGEKLQTQLAPMEALSKEMEAASKPVEEIGRKMEALSKDFEREVERTDRQVRAEIDRAIANGLAEEVTVDSRSKR